MERGREKRRCQHSVRSRQNSGAVVQNEEGSSYNHSYTILSFTHTKQFSAFRMESVDYGYVGVLEYVCMCVRAFANWRCGHGRNGPARAWENDATRIHVNECMYTILWE